MLARAELLCPVCDFEISDHPCGFPEQNVDAKFLQFDDLPAEKPVFPDCQRDQRRLMRTLGDPGGDHAIIPSATEIVTSYIP